MTRVYIGCFGSGLGHVAKARKLSAWASGFDVRTKAVRTVEAAAT